MRMMDVTAKAFKTENGKDFVIRGAIVPPDQSPTMTLVDNPFSFAGDDFFIPHLSVNNILNNQGNGNNDNLNYNILGANEVNRHNPFPHHGMHYDYNLRHGHWNIN